MPVADEDVVLGINISTGLTENVTIPATDMSIRPIVRHPELGLITLIQLQELYGGTLYANNTELYDCEIPLEIQLFIQVNVPYIEFMDENAEDGMRDSASPACKGAEGCRNISITLLPCIGMKDRRPRACCTPFTASPKMASCIRNVTPDGSHVAFWYAGTG